ncbi:MAG: uracil-DNA glycosylase [Gammaproteobacteria bacterium]
MSPRAPSAKPILYDRDCRRCARLADFLIDVKSRYPDYACKPVEPFGDPNARLLVVGLAPGLHGANATGRPFTGDHAGIMLFETLHRFGFSSQAASSPGDQLVLRQCRITNAVKCLPPQNKPVAAEVNQCRLFLSEELKTVRKGGVILTLGKISHDSVLRALGLSVSALPFRHLGEYSLPQDRILLSSYHCSRYNTQTGRLTQKMFDAVFRRARELIA